MAKVLRYISIFSLGFIWSLSVSCAGGNGSTDPDTKGENPDGIDSDLHGDVTEPVLIPQKIVLSSVDSRDGQLSILGMEGAFTSLSKAKRSKTSTLAGWVTLSSNLETVEAQVSPNGSFVAILQAQPGSEVWLEPYGSVEVAGAAVSGRVPGNEQSSNFAQLEIATDIEGRLEVSNLDPLAQGTRILLGNDRTGEVYEGWVNGSGKFKFDLPGEPLDLLILLLADENAVSAPLRGLVDSLCDNGFCGADDLCVNPPYSLAEECELVQAAELNECSNADALQKNRLISDPGRRDSDDDDDVTPPLVDDDDNVPGNDKPPHCKPNKCKFEKLCGSTD